MKWLKSRWFLVCATVLLAGVIIAQTISIPSFTGISTFDVVDFSNGTLQANTILKVRNDNWFSYSGQDLRFSMFYKGHLIANGRSTESFRFEKHSDNLFPVSTDLYVDSLFDDLKSILFKDSIEVKVAVSGKFTFLKINSSRDLQSSINTKELVDALVQKTMGSDGLKMERVKVREITIPATTLNVGFRFKNKLPFELLLKEIRGSIYADRALKTKVSDWGFGADKVLKENEIELIEGTATVDNVNSALTGMSKVLNGTMDYYLNGHALVSVDGREIKIPLRQHFKVNLLTKEIIILDNFK